MKTKPNRRANDPKCMHTIWVKFLGTPDSPNVSFFCQRPRAHLGPHVSRNIGEVRIYSKPIVNTNFNVTWHSYTGLKY